MVPSPGTAAFGLLALGAVLGGGFAVWGLPVAPALGQPGTFVEAPATATDLANGILNNSPALASDPSNPDLVAMAHRVDGSDRGCGLQISGDGGEGWVGVEPLGKLPPGIDRCHSPMAAFDGQGNLYYSFLGLAGPDHRVGGVFLTRSADGARTFSPPSRVAGPLAYGARVAVDLRSGRIHVAWLQAAEEPTATGFSSPTNTIMAAHSDDGGATFSAPVVVAAPMGRRLAAPALAVGPDGRVEVAFYDLGDDARDYGGTDGLTWDGRWSLLASRSSDGGARFLPATTVDETIAPAFRVPSIFTMAPPALAAGKGRTCLAWTDARYGDADVLVRCARDGARWSAEQRVNQDPMGNGISQYLPQLGLAASGRLDIAFYDRRGNQRNEQAAVGYSYSYDGRVFSPNTAVSQSYFDPTVGPKGPAGSSAATDFGSQIGLASTHSSALIAWADTRNRGDGGSVQDIYSAQASLLFTSDRPGWAVPVGMAVAAGSAAGMWLLRRRATPPS